MGSAKRTIYWYWQGTKTYKYHMFGSWIFFPLGFFLQSLFVPILEAQAITQLIEGTLTESGLIRFALLYLFVRVMLSQILIRIGANLNARQFTGALEQLRLMSYENLLLRGQTFHKNSFGGSLVSKINSFTGNYAQLSGVILYSLIPTAISLLFVSVYLLLRAPLIGLPVLAICLSTTLLIYRLTGRRAVLNKQVAALRSKSTGQIADAITNIDAVQANAAEDFEHSRVRETLSKMSATHYKSMLFKSMRLDLLSGISSGVAQLIVVSLSAWLVLQGRIDIGLMYISLRYGALLTTRFFDLNNAIKTIEQVFSDAHEMTEILDTPIEYTDSSDAKELRIKKADITFEDVSFRYQDAELNDHVFKNISLNIPHGQKVGLIGTSGGGKTTMVKLLLGFMQPTAGKIMISGTDISFITRKSLRTNISYVPQEPLLFHRTITENIAYGQLNPKAIDIQRAAKLSYSDQFISQLSKGYETYVGERGVKLSGGQKQRIALARAIYRDSSIVLLDEATSALDSESEEYIQKALKKLMEGKTAIVVAHRLSTIKDMDRIIVLDKGKIVEDGSHRELLADGGNYAKLWAKQTDGFIS